MRSRAGHIQIMNEERLTKRAWKTEVDGKRKRGRPTLRRTRGRLILRRRDSVRRNVERVEMSSREWERMEEDRDGWRRLVNRAKTIKGPHPAIDHGEREG